MNSGEALGSDQIADQMLFLQELMHSHLVRLMLPSGCRLSTKGMRHELVVLQSFRQVHLSPQPIPFITYLAQVRH